MLQDSRPISIPRVLATDLDGTLIPLDGNERNLQDLETLRNHLATHSIELIFVTGRHLEIVEEAVVRHQLPPPNWVICDVGTSIYQSSQTGWRPVSAYQQHLDAICAQFPRPELQRRLVGTDALTLQEPQKQRPFKLSYYVDQRELPSIADRLRQWLREQSAPWSLIESIDPFTGDGLIDLLPSDVSKAYAVDWWRQQGGFDREEIVFAGDSGNDLAALVAGYRAIVVGNADRNLADRVQQHHSRQGWTDRLHLAQAVATSGVLEGIQAFATPIRSRPPTLGATVLSQTQTDFAVWAPHCQAVTIQIEQDGRRRTHPLEEIENGYFQTVLDRAGPGTRYAFRLNDSLTRPDPRSRYQPDGVHGPSQVIDPSTYKWRDDEWRGIAKSDLVIYELHIGTFTDDGTFRSAIDRLEEVRDLGITAIEVMPVAQAPGRWNWGYDGVGLFAPSNNYGTPEDFRAFVDAAHAAGLAVILDVVYNHLGPEGNYLSDFGPYLSQRHHTPWGEAFNFDGPQSLPVRQLIIDNALYWLDEFHLDGLRLDAVDSMHDDSNRHILYAIPKSRNCLFVHCCTSHPSHRRGQPIRSPAAASSEFGNRALRCHPGAMTSCTRSMPSPRLKRCTSSDRISHPIWPRAFCTVISTLVPRRGASHRKNEQDFIPPEPVLTLHSFIIALQNHDVVGNDVYGRRFAHLTSPEAQQAAAALVLLYPAIPLVFMGEESAVDSPFRFFTDFEDDVFRQAVVRGRAQEYPQHKGIDCISAIDPRAFTESKLATDGSRSLRAWYQSLLRIRRKWQADGVLSAERLEVQAWPEHHVYVLRYRDDALLSRFVVIRLTPPTGGSGPIFITMDGTIETHNTSASLRSDSMPQRMTLAANSVIVGSGSTKVGFLE